MNYSRASSQVKLKWKKKPISFHNMTFKENINSWTPLTENQGTVKWYYVIKDECEIRLLNTRTEEIKLDVTKISTNCQEQKDAEIKKRKISQMSLWKNFREQLEDTRSSIVITFVNTDFEDENRMQKTNQNLQTQDILPSNSYAKGCQWIISNWVKEVQR